jgi:hypothetical protein
MRFFVLSAVLLALAAPAAAQNAIEAQMATMRAQAIAVPGVVVTEFPDFTMIEDPANLSIFYFTKPGHYAHPGVVLRVVSQQPDGAWVVRYRTWPYETPEGAPKGFTRWMEEFVALDEAMRADINRNARP